MCGLEQPARTTANHHIHRNAKMGSYPSGLNAVGIKSCLRDVSIEAALRSSEKASQELRRE
jgi:hypothetical protein